MVIETLWSGAQVVGYGLDLEAIVRNHGSAIVGRTAPRPRHSSRNLPRDGARSAIDLRRISTIVSIEIYDAMAEATRSAQPYRTRLDPPPADLRVADPNTRGERPSRPVPPKTAVAEPSAFKLEMQAGSGGDAPSKHRRATKKKGQG